MVLEITKGPSTLIDIHDKFIQNLVAEEVGYGREYCPTQEMVADTITEAPLREQVQKFTNKLEFRPSVSRSVEVDIGTPI